MVASGLAALSLAIWIYLMFGRGGFWRMRVEVLLPGQTPAKIAVIVPARNESAVIGKSMRSLLRQEYGGQFHVFLVDDHSSDSTAEAAATAAVAAGCPDRLTVVTAQPLAEGWTGKLWALSEGLKAAACFEAEYYWFTDADILHDPEALHELLGRAQSGGYDLASLMVKLHCGSFAERMLIPAFVFFFFKLYPPAWVARAHKRTAAAAGGCILIRATALERIGGIAAIRKQLIDDCALARAVKQSGGRIWLGLTAKSQSLREYESFREIGGMISRTAFTQLRHSALLLILVICGMAITYLAPPAFSAMGHWAALFGAIAWLLMTVIYRPCLRFYGIPGLWAVALPLVALFYLIATVSSAVQYWAGRGGTWKGRVQDQRAPETPSLHPSL